jgi:hypothetical protein
MIKQKLDNLIVGIVLGAILPVIGMVVYWMFTYRQANISFGAFLEYFSTMHVIVAAMSLSVYACNLPLFFGFIWGNMNNAARGVLYSTMGYTAWVIYEKFIA